MTHLKIFLHHGSVAVLAAHGIVQAAFVEVFLGNVQAAVIGRAFDQRIYTVQHDMVVNISTLASPVAARLGVGTLDHQLVQHGLDDPGYRA